MVCFVVDICFKFGLIFDHLVLWVDVCCCLFVIFRCLLLFIDFRLRLRFGF